MLTKKESSKNAKVQMNMQKKTKKTRYKDV